LDHLCDIDDTVAVGNSQRLHDLRIHSHTACYCDRNSSDQDHSRTKALLAPKTGGSSPMDNHL
jgi:hypothetical protein